MSLTFLPMSIGFMSHVDFKKWPCLRVDFKGQGPFNHSNPGVVVLTPYGLMGSNMLLGNITLFQMLVSLKSTSLRSLNSRTWSYSMSPIEHKKTVV